jgi:hypothetical protein
MQEVGQQKGASVYWEAWKDVLEGSSWARKEV